MNFKILKHQAEFIESKTINTGLIGGFGSGKTYAGISKSIIQMVEHQINIAYYLPIYQLITDVAIPNFEHLLHEFGIDFETNKVEKKITTPYGKIMMRSFDNPKTIVAYEVGYSVIDEADTVGKDKMRVIYRQVHGRNRQTLPNNESPKLDFVSTPHGHKFLYEFFVTNQNKDRKVIRAKTDDNFFVHQSFIEGMQRDYSSTEIDAFRYGLFVNLTTGLVYRSFNKELNGSKLFPVLNETLHVGMDFNVGKMAAVVFIVRGGKIHAVDEFFGAQDTRDLVKQILVKYITHHIICYPDSSGNNRSTNSNITDIQILRKDFTVDVKHNPSVKNRINKVNACFENDMGERELFINEERCSHLVLCLESQVYKDGKPDKNNDFDHLIDAGGYFIYNWKSTPRTTTPLNRRFGNVGG